ncbi:MAG TPA: hypothetical protein VFK13_08675 [Gemmatimonadaceae bacterium]|nr:hypothetical protein [Gemmatimonadaceae bacterium]
MMRWLRRLRAAAGIGLTWGAAWLGAGLVLLAIVGLDAADVPFPLFFGLLGFLAGFAFSVILSILGRRRRFDQISLPRFAAWGALGGLALSGVFSLTVGMHANEFPMLGAIFAAAGAVSATGTLALARRAEGHASLGGGEDHGELGAGSDDIREIEGRN